jgi:hypothetical protein
VRIAPSGKARGRVVVNKFIGNFVGEHVANNEGCLARSVISTEKPMSLNLEKGDAVPSMIGSQDVRPQPIPSTPPSAGLITEEAIDPIDGSQVVAVDGVHVPRPPCISRKFEGGDEASDFPLETAVLQGR